MRYLLLILTCFIGASATESAIAEPNDKFTCSTTSVEAFNASNADNPYFSLRLVRGEKHRDINFGSEFELFSVRCEHGSKGKQFVLVNHTCGAIGCNASNWGIIDPRSLKVILVPNQPYIGNEDNAIELIGHSPKPFSCGNRSPNSAGAQGKGEFCYISSFHKD